MIQIVLKSFLILAMTNRIIYCHILNASIKSYIEFDSTFNNKLRLTISKFYVSFVYLLSIPDFITIFVY